MFYTVWDNVFSEISFGIAINTQYIVDILNRPEIPPSPTPESKSKVGLIVLSSIGGLVLLIIVVYIIYKVKTASKADVIFPENQTFQVNDNNNDDSLPSQEASRIGLLSEMSPTGV